MPSRKPKPASARTPTVEQFLESLDHPHKSGIVLLRRLILSLDERITEEIKWNAPSFKLEEHFATFKLYPPKNIQLVLHTGAKAKQKVPSFEIDDPEGLLAWPAADRCVLTLSTAADAIARQEAVMRIVAQWVAQL